MVKYLPFIWLTFCHTNTNNENETTPTFRKKTLLQIFGFKENYLHT